MKKKTILLTGASGNMGQEGLKQLYSHKERFNIIVFSLPTPKDRKILRTYEKDPSVRIVWGDLANETDVKQAVAQADIVLHVGALVSPKADRLPDLAWKVNFEGTKHLVDAVLARADRDHVKFLYVGSVAQTGNRVPPYHWGRVGDPLLPSAYDYYALSKIAAERYVIESGLKYWVSIRQTGIMHEHLLAVNGGIGYHQPLNNHLEWVSAHDSGKLLLHVCSDEVPDSFWRKVYNVGGGESCRLTSFELYQKVYGMLGVDCRELEEPNWYALRNFHGQYYYDSDELEAYLHFRSENVDDVLSRIRKQLPFRLRLLKYLPKRMVRNSMRRRVLKEDTPLNWIANQQEGKIKAFLGSKEQWEQIPGWDEFELISDPPHQQLHHGYDETKADAALGLKDMQEAAAFRGGKCLSVRMTKGDLYTKLGWECAHGHEFEASPYLILKAGHWCETCMQPPWNFDKQAKLNPFIAQLWYMDHDCQENNRYQ